MGGIISYGQQLCMSSNSMNIKLAVTLFGSPLPAVVLSRRLIKIYQVFASLLISGILFNGYQVLSYGYQGDCGRA